MEKRIQCLGIILDGNRRWAKERGLPTLEGHRRGSEVLKEAAKWVRDRNIPHLVVYAFSTENWQRAPEEVSYLMEIFRQAVRELGADAKKEAIAVRFLGERERFSEDLQKSMAEVEVGAPSEVKLTLWLCLSYGGRAEIVEAARRAGEVGEITEESLRSHMWSAQMPDPDIILRTGGAQRLSNFLLWQAAYSELVFLDEFWPDFNEILLDKVLETYAARERRMGK